MANGHRMVNAPYLTLSEARALYDWIHKQSLPRDNYQVTLEAVRKLGLYVEAGSTHEVAQSVTAQNALLKRHRGGA